MFNGNLASKSSKNVLVTKSTPIQLRLLCESLPELQEAAIDHLRIRGILWYPII